MGTDNEERQKMTNQIQRRFEEIMAAGNADFSKGTNIKAFYGKIADYINTFEEKETYRKRLLKLRSNAAITKLNDELVAEGEEILRDLRKQYAYILAAITDKDIKLPTNAEVYSKRVSGAAFSLTSEEALGSGLDMLGRALKEDTDIDISQVSNVISRFFGVIMDLHYLQILDLQQYTQELTLKNRKYQMLFDRRKRQLEFLGLTAYDNLVQVRDALDDDGQFGKGLGFKLKESYQAAKPDASDWLLTSDKQKIEKERIEYLETAQKANVLVQELIWGNTRRIKAWLFWVDEYWQYRIIRDLAKYGFSTAGGFLVGFNWLSLWSQIEMFWKSLPF